jgi:3-hydroxyacyl-CoA dehydrogenase/enoyl-CoA hydratase/3-hydroxybutyryl-CoA epimerase
MRHIRLDKTSSDGAAVLTLDTADATMNIVTSEWLAEMNEAIAQVAADASIKGLIITSAKTAFMAGADLKFLVGAFEGLSPREAYAFSQQASRMHRSLETMGKPVVAALSGLCLGGGFELALACQHRVIVDDPRALVGLPEVNVGLLPGSGGTQRLPRLIGVKAALDLLLSGRSVGPQEALRLRLVDELVPAERLLERSRSLLTACQDSARPWDRKGFALPESRGMVLPEAAAMFSEAAAGLAKAGYNQPAPIAILSGVFQGVQLPFDRALQVESKYFARLLTNPVARNIIRTSFISKQAAGKRRAAPPSGAMPKARKIGVLGAGMMGAGIALAAAHAGVEVVLLDRDVATAGKGRDYGVRFLRKAVERGGLAAAEAEAIGGRIAPTDDYARLADVDLVIEAVFEDLQIKAEVLKKVQAVVPPAAVIASNTSTLPIGDLAKALERPERFIGLHFFSPVERMALVEVVVGRQTGPQTLEAGLDLVAQLGKTPIVVNDGRGFYTSRVVQTLIHEGAAMLRDGVEPARIENAARSAGFSVGPLALLDEVTIDLPLKIVEQAVEQEGASYVAPAGLPVMQRMRELGRTSRKAGGGFYDYPEGSKKRLWPGLRDAFPPAALQPEQGELIKRLLYVQAIETARCLEAGVLQTPQDADLGAVYGWGFPAWTGGTLSFIDTTGLQTFVEEADRLAQAYGPRFLPSAWLRARATKQQPFYDRVAAKGIECSA